MRYGVLALALIAALAALPAAGAPSPRRSTLAPGWDEHSARWSPDGSLILFQRDYEPARSGPSLELAVVRPDGSGRRRLGVAEQRDTEEWDFVGAWSPDGRRVAFYRRFGMELDRLYVINADGSGQRRLTSLQLDASEFSPSWSPDGRRLVFTRNLHPRNEDEGLFTVSVDGGDVTQVTRGNGEFSPVWSPDGGLIAFVRLEAGSRSAVYLVRPDGGGLRRLGPGGAPVWSPDGQRILVSNGDALVAWRRDGSASTRLVSGSVGAWSPDGTRIAFRRGGSLFVMPAAGGTPQLLHSESRTLVDRPAWSPDGRRLAFGYAGRCLAVGLYVVDVATRVKTGITNDCRVRGTTGPDLLRGTHERDVVTALAGNDFVDGNPGDRANEYAGRDDDDVLDGGAGNDVLWGRRGTDVLLGGVGNDRLRGGRGADRLVGGPGNDLLDGGRYLDRLDGGPGDDVFAARDGFRDRISCGSGRDSVVADLVDIVARDCERVTRRAA